MTDSASQSKNLETWINQLKDEKPANREQALKLLSELGDPKTIPAIVQVLQTDRNHNLRRDAAIALGMINHADAVQPLLDALSCKQEKFISLEIIQALSKIGDPNSVLSLVRLLTEDDDRRVHFMVLNALACIGGQKSIDGLRNAMVHCRRAPNLLARIIMDLGKLEARDAVDDIRKVLVDEENDNVARAAVTALATILKDDSVSELAEVLKHHQVPKVRKRAVDALGNLASPSTIAPLCLALLDVELSSSSVEALRKINDWKEKTLSFIRLLREGGYQRSDLPCREIVAALNPSAEVLSENPFTLTDYLIETCIDQDARMTANLAALIIASTNGDLASAGVRINKFASINGISGRALEQLRAHPRGQTRTKDK